MLKLAFDFMRDALWSTDFLYYLFGVLVGWLSGRYWPVEKSQEEKEAP